MPALIPVDNVLGAFFLGVIFSSILYGVTWLQVYSYFSKHCEGDRLFLKCFNRILDTLQLAFVVHGFYVAGVTNFGDYLADLRAPWSLKVQSLIGSRGWGCLDCWLPGKLTVSFDRSWDCFQYPYFDQAKVQVPNLTAGLSIQVACDLTITASMVYYLLTRHETVVKRVFSITCLVTKPQYTVNPSQFMRFSHTLIYAPFFFVLVRLYACAFMAVLNSRSRLRTSLNAGVVKGTMISFSHGTSTLSHVRGSDVTSAGAGANASNADAIGPQFATQSTISGISRTKHLPPPRWLIEMEGPIANYDEALLGFSPERT
ncbi:hypothetical protein EDB86DRAFT_2824889 [Lactarius hatsudake]|nr:hypothetical protein EDB86DRAFT_2824889 [Lactarius hatsudake]